MNNTSHPPRIAGLSEIVGDYRFILCDAWGVLHNGLRAYDVAVDALRRARGAGKRVLIVTNAPRPRSRVLDLFTRLGVDHDAFDDIVTSGDVAHEHFAGRPRLKVHHLGPDRDRPIYDGTEVVLVSEDDAELISCTGLLNDEVETPDDYADALARWKVRGIPMLCANPDKVVERGHKLVWCAGAIAERYEEMGGAVVSLGKPHAPIFDASLQRFRAMSGERVAKEAVLVIGDSLETDLRGAAGAGIDALFVTAGIHSDAYGPRENPDADKVGAILKDARLGARAFIPHLAW